MDIKGITKQKLYNIIFFSIISCGYLLFGHLIVYEIVKCPCGNNDNYYRINYPSLLNTNLTLELINNTNQNKTLITFEPFNKTYTNITFIK